MTETLCLFSVLTINIDQSAIQYFNIVKDKLKLISKYSTDHTDNKTTLNISGGIQISKDGLKCMGRIYLFKEEILCISDSCNNILSIQNSLLSDEINIKIETGFKENEFYTILENIIFCNLIKKKILPVHSGGLYFRGKGYLLAAWGGVGKTRILLNALSLDSATISDEWNFVFQEKIFPFDDKLLLMYYDILDHPEYSSLFDYIRSKLFSYALRCNIIILKVLERCKIIMRYKIISIPNQNCNNISPFNLDKAYYLQKALVPHLLKKHYSTAKMSEAIVLNFSHERDTMFSLLNYSSFVFGSKYNESIVIKDKYKSLIEEYLSGKMGTILIPIGKPTEYNRLISML
jgi:hypothetical protein